MTGTHHGAIDFNWLLSNLEVGEVPYGVDDEIVGKRETFVLGPKALHAAEAYLLGLFQLYATVYLHKATRGAEQLFTELLSRVVKLAQNNSAAQSGLPGSHPLIRFAKNPGKLQAVLDLDDTVISGAISMMAEAKDSLVSDFSKRLRDRHLFKCIDIRESLNRRFCRPNPEEEEVLSKACRAIGDALAGWSQQNSGDIPRILIDNAERPLYKLQQESKGPIDQIMIQMGDGNDDPVDVATVSQFIKAVHPFRVFRVYFEAGDEKAKLAIQQAIAEGVKQCQRE